MEMKIRNESSLERFIQKCNSVLKIIVHFFAVI